MNSEMRLASHNRTITFREVTVQDAMNLSQIPERQEEKAVTWWLNTLQEGEVFDAREWSQEDRLLGLLYLFFLTQEDVKRNVSYQCGTCEERHTFLADYAELAQRNVETKDVWPTIALQDGKYTLQPLTGKDAEELEEFRLSQPEPNQNQIRLHTIARRLQVTPEELTGLSLKAYSTLLREAEEQQEQLVHGITFTVERHCPNAKEEGEATRIVLPFQTNEFLPRI